MKGQFHLLLITYNVASGRRTYATLLLQCTLSYCVYVYLAESKCPYFTALADLWTLGGGPRAVQIHKSSSQQGA